MKRSQIRRRTPIRAKSSKQVTHLALHALWRKVLIRQRGNRCEASGMGGMACTPVLQAHHIWPKARCPALRYELENGLLACTAHHRFFIHEAPASEVGPWLVTVCGQDRLDRLALKAKAANHGKTRTDFVAERIRLEQMLSATA